MQSRDFDRKIIVSLMEADAVVSKVATELRCLPDDAERVVRAVMQALRDGLNTEEAAAISLSLPTGLRDLWPPEAGARPGLADLGDTGFLGRVGELGGIAGQDETKRAVGAVMKALMVSMAIPGEDRARAWSALTHLPPELKIVWTKIFRAASFPVELYAQRPENVGRRFSRNARTPSR